MSSKLKIIFSSVCILVFHNIQLTKGISYVGVKNFHSFSNDLIIFSNKTAEAVDIKPGVKLFSPFGVGYLLATIQGKLWDVPTNGINQVLQTQEHSIVDEYSVLLQEFNFQSISTSSVVYTRYKNITQQGNEPYLSKLNTQIKQIDFITEPEKFWSIISEQVANGTNEQLKDELIPEVMWQKIFENSTQGAFVNTLHHKSHWDIPWQDIGEKSFNYDTIIKFYEREGEFPVLESDTFSAVQVELQNNSKQIVFIKPHSFMDLSKIREEIKQISANSGSGNKWTIRKLKLQIPALNVTNLSRNHQGLVEMGISDAFCRSNESDPEEYKFELQPIAQANHFEFSGDFIEIASATGAIINYNKYIPKEVVDDGEEDEEEVDDYQNVEEEEQIDVDVDMEDISTFTESRQLSKHNIKSNLRKVGLGIEGHCEKPEEFGISHRKSQSAIHDRDGKATLVFDTPFFYFVQDNQLGEIFSGVINSLCQYNRVALATRSNADHAWLHNVFKVAFWKCV